MLDGHRPQKESGRRHGGLPSSAKGKPPIQRGRAAAARRMPRMAWSNAGGRQQEATRRIRPCRPWHSFCQRSHSDCGRWHPAKPSTAFHWRPLAWRIAMDGKNIAVDGNAACDRSPAHRHRDARARSFPVDVSLGGMRRWRACIGESADRPGRAFRRGWRCGSGFSNSTVAFRTAPLQSAPPAVRIPAAGTRARSMGERAVLVRRRHTRSRQSTFRASKRSTARMRCTAAAQRARSLLPCPRSPPLPRLRLSVPLPN